MHPAIVDGSRLINNFHGCFRFVKIGPSGPLWHPAKAGRVTDWHTLLPIVYCF